MRLRHLFPPRWSDDPGLHWIVLASLLAWLYALRCQQTVGEVAAAHWAPEPDFDYATDVVWMHRNSVNMHAIVGNFFVDFHGIRIINQVNENVLEKVFHAKPLCVAVTLRSVLRVLRLPL